MNEVLLRGLRKRAAAENLTVVEQRAVKAWDKAESRRHVDSWLRRCPVGEFRQAAGLNRSQADRLAAQRGLRLNGPHVDLSAILPVLFQMLLDADDVDPDAGDSPALERLRTAKAKIAELDLAERQGSLLSVAEITDRLTDIATIMRQRSEAMARVGGPAVQRAFEDMLDEVEDAVKRWYSMDGDADDIDEPERPQAKGKQ